jgi:hypothetical protein
VQKIDFFGMRQVKELGTIQSVYTNLASDSQLSSTYAIGFTSADFIIWDLGNETKVTEYMYHMNWPVRINGSANQQFQTFMFYIDGSSILWRLAAPLFLLSWDSPRISELLCLYKGLCSKFLYLCFVDLFSQLMF